MKTNGFTRSRVRERVRFKILRAELISRLITKFDNAWHNNVSGSVLSFYLMIN